MTCSQRLQPLEGTIRGRCSPPKAYRTSHRSRLARVIPYAVSSRCWQYEYGPRSVRLGAGAEAEVAPRLAAHWRVATVRQQTVDEYGVLFRNLFAMAGLEPGAIRGIIISSVVPPLDSTLREVCEKYFRTTPVFVEPGVKTGMPVQYDNPAEVGADRVANGVAAFERYGGPCVVVDFGTATTFDAISAKGEYLGGIIAPGNRHFRRGAVFANGAPAAGGHSPAAKGDRYQYRGQYPVRSFLRVPGAGGWNSGTAGWRDWVRRRGWLLRED